MYPQRVDFLMNKLAVGTQYNATSGLQKAIFYCETAYKDVLGNCSAQVL